MRSRFTWASTEYIPERYVHLGSSNDFAGAFDSRVFRQGYLFGAKVLVRPLTERAVTMVYLFKKPDAQQIWDDGWKHGKRPNLQQMVEYLNSTLSQGALPSMKGFTHALNSATHGDPLSAQWNVVLREDGAPVFFPPRTYNPPVSRTKSVW